jgi:hypothetical protein
LIVNAGGSAGKDDSIWRKIGNFICRDIERNNLRINLQLTNAPADDLGVLRTEIEDENFRVFRRGLGLHANHG